MRRLQIAGHLTNAQVQAKLSQSRDTASHNRWQIIYLIQVGNIHAAELLAPLVNLSVHSIYKIVENHNHAGADALILQSKRRQKKVTAQS